MSNAPERRGHAASDATPGAHAWLPLINSDAKVMVDADMYPELKAYEWVLASGHVISHSREGWQGLIDLAWHIAGPGAERKAGSGLDYRRQSLIPAGGE
jgi:hypothetical protein